MSIQKLIEEYESKDVAIYLRALAIQMNKPPLNVTQTQKLLYILYAYYMVSVPPYNDGNGCRIINESPQAWPYGPVFPKTRKILIYYQILKGFTIKEY